MDGHEVGQQKREKRKPTQHEQMLSEIGHLDASAFAGHLIDNVADEVALEGLDGITIQALKVRLEIRPNFQIEGFEDVGAAVWNQIKRSKYFTFYLLPNARPDLSLYNWDQYRDDRGNVVEPLHSPEEIYPYFPVEDKENGIRGSCEHYQTRRDITFIVRRINYLNAVQKFGNRLVIVANQILRERALFGANFKKQQALTIVQYCITERVGRSRQNGEITRGKVSLTCMKIPPKTLFYQRKALLSGGILLRQVASIKFTNCKCPAIVTVFHLPRFYRRIESISNLNIRTIFAWLNKSPDKCVSVESIVSKYGKHTLRGIQQQFPTLLETAWHQLIEAPQDLNDETEFTKPSKPKTIRVLRFKVSDLQVQSQLIKNGLEGQSGEDDGGDTGGHAGQDDSEENQIVNLNSANSYSDISILRPPHHYVTVCNSYFLYKALIRAGTGGLTLSDFGFLYLTPLEARSASRILTRTKVCTEGELKLHKQKAFTYTLTTFALEAYKINFELQDKCIYALAEITRIRKMMDLHKAKKKGKSIRIIPFADLVSNSTTEGNLPISNDIQPAYEEVDIKPAVDTIEFTDNLSVTGRAKSKSPKKSSQSKKSPKKAKAGAEGGELAPPVRIPTLCLVQPPDANAPMDEGTTSTSEHLHPSVDVEPEKSTGLVFEAETIGSVTVTEIQGDQENDFSVMEGSEDEETSGEAGLKKRGDEVDDEIRSRMSRQRVDWNKHEDRYILIAYIASALFISKCNFTKIFIFNSSQIRDLLLKRTNGKSTKTSPAIRRRVHFLMHQKSNFDLYLGLIGAAVRDNTLYETYIKEHLHPPQNKIYTDILSEPLETVINYLYEKFNHEEFIPTDTRISVNELETILFLRQLKRSEFYWNALTFAIFCPTGNLQTERQKFRLMWRKLIQNESNSEAATTEKSFVSPIIAETRQEINKDLTCDVNTHDADDCEIESITLEDADEEKTTEDYHREYSFRFFKFLTKQLQTIFNNMLMLGSVRTSKGFQLICFDPNLMRSGSIGPGFNICLSTRECNSTLDIRLWGARCLILDYVLCGDNSKVLGKSAKDGTKLPLEKAASLLTGGKVLVCSKRTGLLWLSRSNLRQFLMGPAPVSYDETLEFLNYIDEASNVDSSACISIGILFGIVELTDYFRSSISVIDSVFTLNDEWVPIYDGISQEDDLSRYRNIKKKKQKRFASTSEAPSAKRQRLTQEEENDIEDLIDCFEDIERDIFIPRSQSNVGLDEGENYISNSTNALRLLRIRLNQAGVHMPRQQFAGFVERDFFTINLPSLEFVFPRRTGLNHAIAGSSHPYTGEELKDLKRALVEIVIHDASITNSSNSKSTYIQHIEKHLKRYGILFQLINLAGKVGISGTFLKRKFERKSLIKGLRYLLECKLIFSVGIAQRRFVSYNNANDWIIPIRSASGENILGHVIIRPWITSLGAISWPTVRRLFISLLGQLQKPAVSFDELCESLSPTLSPVEVTVLIEAFAKMKYLTVYKVHESDCTMFSRHSKAEPKIEYNADTLIDMENVYVGVSPYTTFLYSQLHNASQKAYKRSNAAEKTPGAKYELTMSKRKRHRTAKEVG